MLRNSDNFKTSEEYCLVRKSFNRVHCQLQLHCESHCRKYKLDKLEWPPRITKIGPRLRIYRWIVGFKWGKKCNILNLKRTCRNNLQKSKSDPKSRYCLHTMTIEEAGNKVAACMRELDRLGKEVLFLRTEHLPDMLNKARK